MVNHHRLTTISLKYWHCTKIWHNLRECELFQNWKECESLTCQIAAHRSPLTCLIAAHRSRTVLHHSCWLVSVDCGVDGWELGWWTDVSCPMVMGEYDRWRRPMQQVHIHWWEWATAAPVKHQNEFETTSFLGFCTRTACVPTMETASWTNRIAPN
jgi:hypothetical protein